jgi:hypothetical protein
MSEGDEAHGGKGFFTQLLYNYHKTTFGVNAFISLHPNEGHRPPPPALPEIPFNPSLPKADRFA